MSAPVLSVFVFPFYVQKPVAACDYMSHGAGLIALFACYKTFLLRFMKPT